VPAGHPLEGTHAPMRHTWPAGHSLSARHVVGPASADASVPASADASVPASGGGMIPVHTPARHAAPAGHAVPHAPQVRGSVARSTQLVPQRVVPPMQPAPPSVVVLWQRPITHTCPAPHSRSVRHGAPSRAGTNSEKCDTRATTTRRAASYVVSGT